MSREQVVTNSTQSTTLDFIDKDEKVELDKHFHIGDMVLFSPGLRHGVSAVEPMDSKIKSDGRYFLNMNLIQSHHVKDRIPALGIDL